MRSSAAGLAFGSAATEICSYFFSKSSDSRARPQFLALEKTVGQADGLGKKGR